MQTIELRDYIAGQLLPSIVAGACRPLDRDFVESAAAEAYELADAMLAARGLAKPPATEEPDALTGRPRGEADEWLLIGMRRNEAELVQEALRLASQTYPMRGREFNFVEEIIRHWVRAMS